MEGGGRGGWGGLFERRGACWSGAGGPGPDAVVCGEGKSRGREGRGEGGRERCAVDLVPVDLGPDAVVRGGGRGRGGEEGVCCWPGAGGPGPWRRRAWLQGRRPATWWPRRAAASRSCAPRAGSSGCCRCPQACNTWAQLSNRQHSNGS